MHCEHTFFLVTYFVIARGGYQFAGNYITNWEDFSAQPGINAHHFHPHSIARPQEHSHISLEGWKLEARKNVEKMEK